MSIKVYKVRSDEDLILVDTSIDPLSLDRGFVLSLLIDGPTARLTKDDNLVPCFDLEELARRNQQKRRT